jgi:hypothetical protein
VCAIAAAKEGRRPSTPPPPSLLFLVAPPYVSSFLQSLALPLFLLLPLLLLILRIFYLFLQLCSMVLARPWIWKETF